jgi:hypothetical protein
LRLCHLFCLVCSGVLPAKYSFQTTYPQNIVSKQLRVRCGFCPEFLVLYLLF